MFGFPFPGMGGAGAFPQAPMAPSMAPSMAPQPSMGMWGATPAMGPWGAVPSSQQMFPPAPQQPGMFGGASGGDMLGMAAKSVGGGQSSQQPAPPPSFYQPSQKQAPRLDPLRYEGQRPQGGLKYMLGVGQ